MFEEMQICHNYKGVNFETLNGKNESHICRKVLACHVSHSIGYQWYPNSLVYIHNLLKNFSNICIFIYLYNYYELSEGIFKIFVLFIDISQVSISVSGTERTQYIDVE